MKRCGGEVRWGGVVKKCVGEGVVMWHGGEVRWRHVFESCQRGVSENCGVEVWWTGCSEGGAVEMV